MALHVLNSLIVANYPTKKDTQFAQGACLARDLSGAEAGLVRKADRATDTGANWVGFSADNHQRSGNTMILNDPVGSNYVNASGVLVENANGFYVVDKRAIGDFQDEPVTGVTNPTAGVGGFEGPRRGVGVFTSPSGQFITDQFALAQTDTATADVAFTGGDTYEIGDAVTFGAGVNAGLLVKVDSASDGRAVGVVDLFDSAAGLLYFTQV